MSTIFIYAWYVYMLYIIMQCFGATILCNYCISFTKGICTVPTVNSVTIFKPSYFVSFNNKTIDELWRLSAQENLLMKAALTHIHKLFRKYFFTLDLLSHHVTITFSIDFLKGEQLQLK